jgi:phosphoribosylformylglycinamidine cyclo-ligase
MSDRHTYAAAGVSLEAAEAVVGRLAGAVASTRRPGVVEAHGGFAGLFELGDRLLVAATDGVGTKLALHREAGTMHAAGIDCVAMCVNDVLCTGAEPLFLLDYVAVGRLDPEQVAGLVEGIADGCRQAGCALLGGETAEHPGVMQPSDLDVAGFCVGIVARNALIDGRRVEPGDAVVGIASTGLHSNGFSLVRRLLDTHGIDLADAPPELLAPTAIYAPEARALIDAVDVRALCHVTGGGIEGNLPRVLPAGYGADIDLTAWPCPAVIDWVATLGVAEDELLRVFNCGLGFLAVVPAAEAAAAIGAVSATGRDAWEVGRITAGPGVSFRR